MWEYIYKLTLWIGVLITVWNLMSSASSIIAHYGKLSMYICNIFLSNFIPVYIIHLICCHIKMPSNCHTLHISAYCAIIYCLLFTMPYLWYAPRNFYFLSLKSVYSPDHSIHCRSTSRGDIFLNKAMYLFRQNL